MEHALFVTLVNALLALVACAGLVVWAFRQF